MQLWATQTQMGQCVQVATVCAYDIVSGAVCLNHFFSVSAKTPFYNFDGLTYECSVTVNYTIKINGNTIFFSCFS